MVSRVYTYLQTHQVGHIKYVQFLYVNHTLIKWCKEGKDPHGLADIKSF